MVNVWRTIITHGWQLKPGPSMRRIEQTLRPDLLEQLSQTYVGITPQELWDSLDRTRALMRKVAQEVGQALGYAYPESLERKTFAYIAEIRQLPR